MSKPKSTGPSTAVRTAHMCALITVYDCGTQYSTQQFWRFSLLSSRQSSEFRWHLLEGRESQDKNW